MYWQTYIKRVSPCTNNHQRARSIHVFNTTSFKRTLTLLVLRYLRVFLNCPLHKWSVVITLHIFTCPELRSFATFTIFSCWMFHIVLFLHKIRIIFMVNLNSAKETHSRLPEKFIKYNDYCVFPNVFSSGSEESERISQILHISANLLDERLVEQVFFLRGNKIF